MLGSWRKMPAVESMAKATVTLDAQFRISKGAIGPSGIPTPSIGIGNDTSSLEF